MTKHRTVILAVVALLSLSFLAPRVEAADGIMMQGGKMMMMKDGKATGPMDHAMTMPDGHKVMPDGTMTMTDGTAMRMQEGQMMTTDGKMVEPGQARGEAPAMGGGRAMQGSQGMKMDGMK